MTRQRNHRQPLMAVLFAYLFSQSQAQRLSQDDEVDEWALYGCDNPRNDMVACFCGFLEDRIDAAAATAGALMPEELSEQSSIECNADGMAGSYPCSNVNLHSHLPLSTFGSSSANDIWGWTEQNSGREFAILALNDGTAFVEISNPSNPAYLGKLPTHTVSSSWRDVKVYKNFAFVVS